MITLPKTLTLSLTALDMATMTVPAAATGHGHVAPGHSAAPHEENWNRHGRGNDRRSRDYRRYEESRYYNSYGNGYGEPVYRNTQVWQGRDGNYYCRKKDGTTGLIIGAAAGALLGREVDKYGNRTTGTIIGGALGALLGKELTDGTTCR